MLEYLKQLKTKSLKISSSSCDCFYTGDKKTIPPLELNDYFDIPEELKNMLMIGKSKLSMSKK